MAITSSTIRIYSDEELQTLVRTITTQGSDSAIEVSGLSEGETYYATVQVTENQMTSEESDGYEFHTLPDCVFSEAPTAVGTSIYFSTEVNTNSVGIVREGVFCQIANASETGVYVTSDQPTFQSSVDNLRENTTYRLIPCVRDEYGRLWLNTSDMELVTTTAAPPVVGIGDLNASANSVNGSVTVLSTVPLTNLLVRLLPLGGGTYINATGYTTQTGTQQFICNGLTAGTTYTVYATATNMGGSTMSNATVTTTTVIATATLDDCSLDPQSQTDSVYVEASGTVGTGATIDLVGVKFFSSDSTSSTLIADVYGQQGQDFLISTARNLPAGTTMYAFAYMDYAVDNQMFTIYSASQQITTQPIIVINTMNVTSNTCGGNYSVTGTATAIAVKYKTVSAGTWSDADTSVGRNTYLINGLTPNTTYQIKATATNAGGTYETAVTTFTTSQEEARITFEDTSTLEDGVLDWSANFTSTYPMASGTVTACKDDEGYEVLENATVVFEGTTSGIAKSDMSMQIGVDTCVIVFKGVDDEGNKLEDEYWI